MKRVYETDRLILKILDEASSPQVLDYYIRNKDFLEEWELKRPNEFYTLEAQAVQLRNEFKDFEEKRALRLWIFKKDGEDNKAIGLIAFNNIVRGAFLSCFLGYKLDKDEINKGYVTEALKKGIDH
jgi:[ribosomal protein S5]-alanine N-acetyltransferase